MRKNHKGLKISIILILGLVLISPNLRFNIEASEVTSSVIVSVCGNDEIEGDEVCDDGSENNGKYGYCNTECTALGPRCGDEIIQADEGEECDDGNTNSGDGCSSTCQTEEEGETPPPTGGGGGGGWVAPTTKVILQGIAYPGAEITILKDGQVVTGITADSQANFKATLNISTAGIYTFGVWAEDKEGRKSITFAFTITVSSGMTTTIGGIFIPPTIELEKTRLVQGETLNILGQTAPESEVSVYVESEKIIKETTADEEGDWHYAFDTGILEEGIHTTRAKALSLDNLLSTYSNTLIFVVGEEIIVQVKRGDINTDGKINLVDFSILLYNWGVPKNPAADLNDDGKVNLTDFSIMLYWWTG